MSEELETTRSLLARARQGDETARNRLFQRYLPIFRSWAHGRLPAFARDIQETDDLVQSSLMRALNQLDRFEPEREGALLAYLRRILMNQVIDEIRRARRRPEKQELPPELPACNPSPLEQAMAVEALETFERALSRLPEKVQEAVVLRLEFGHKYEEIAEMTGSSSANAVRMAITRALVQISESTSGP